MKVWFDTGLASSDLINDCPGECSDCGYITTDGNLLQLKNPLVLNKDFQLLQASIIQQAKTLYVQMYDNERWIVCNPASSGQVAVLDQQAFALLEHFQKPSRLSEVIQPGIAWSATTLEKAVVVFYSLGLLEDIHNPSVISNRPQTLSAWLHVTNSCNLRCQYCYLYKNSEHMDNDIAYRAVCIAPIK
jgi:uncharacterized protein